MKFLGHVSIDHAEALPAAGIDGFQQLFSVAVFSIAVIAIVGYAKLSRQFVES